MRTTAKQRESIDAWGFQDALGLVVSACAALGMTMSACTTIGPPPMEPLTETALEAATQRWTTNGGDSYRLVVRVRAPRLDPALYDVVVEGGRLVEVARDGEQVRPEEVAGHDFSVQGLFEFLRTELRWNEVASVGDTPAIDLRAHLDVDTGRLVRYRRTVGTTSRRVLLVEVVSYEPRGRKG